MTPIVDRGQLDVDALVGPPSVTERIQIVLCLLVLLGMVLLPLLWAAGVVG